MSSKKKGGAKGGAAAAADDDDWEALLAAEAAANRANEPPPPAPPAAATAPGEDEESDDEDDAGGAAKKDKKKKKKKKAGAKAGDDKAAESAAPAPLSAAARAIFQRQQQQQEEEARFRRLQEEQERKIREEEERLEAEQRAIEEEKERKRKAKADKLEAQKAAGTYMTKAEKEKQKKIAMRLESMRAAGLIADKPSASEEAAAAPTKVVYASKKKQNKQNKAGTKEEEQKQEDEVESAKGGALAEKEASDDEVDDWEAADFSAVAAKIGEIANADQAAAAEEAEDILEVEKRKEQERLRQLGIERIKREEEARQKREEEERLRAEMEKAEREAVMRKENSRRRRMERDAVARAARTPDRLRSPISVIMGHVDTGKTKLLDKIRQTNVQEGEAGGITQQIGATAFSRDVLAAQTAPMQAIDPFNIRIPGLLMIDTPGHESFANLRSRGSSLCDIAILVIDLMHGLEPQTIESLNMLKKRRCPFIVALNKIDRCYNWKSTPNQPFRISLAQQDENCQAEFKDRATRIIVQLMEQGLNASLYYENTDLAHTVSLVPTSALTGEGIPDLLKMVITLTQERMERDLMFMDVLQCTVLEVKVVEGLGHTVDVVLVNGTLHEGDTIIVSTMEGPVVTNIRALLTPPPNRESRVKSEFVHHSSIQGAIGVKIVAPDIGRAVAGTPILVVHPEDDIEDVKDDVQSDLSAVMKALSTDNQGVMVHASTLGALEALLQFLREDCKPPIPVGFINIGPIHKKDVMRANIMNEKGKPEFATILAFDVKVDSEAQEFADDSNVRIFTADIIYHLFDKFSAYMNGITAARRQEAEAVAVYPCILRIIPQHIFNKKSPIILGVDVVEGVLKLGTPLVIPALEFLDLGRVTSIENNRKEVNSAKKGAQVAIKFSNDANPTLTYGRQFDHTQPVYSKISRASIDSLKEFFKAEVAKEDWQLLVKMKKVFNLP